MRRTMIPVLLLAAVALSTGVVLPRRKNLQPGSDPIFRHSRDSQSASSKWGVLRQLFRNKVNRDAVDEHARNILGYDNDNNQEDYTLDLNKGRGGSMDDSIFGYPRYFDRSHTRNSFYKPYSFPDGVADKSINDRFIPDYKLPSTRNNDILVRDDNKYYTIDSFITSTNSLDVFQNRLNCLYKSMSGPSSTEAPSTDSDKLEMQEEREKLNNEPFVKQVIRKRHDDFSENGEKEFPDVLVFNSLEKDEVQKKLFSFLSRLQALSHKGRQVPTRRHTFVYYGPDGDGARDGPLTAETRASHLRPPGQPLRWG